ncbi:hypothetical protein CsSME_00025246 [Camellia sinensis var. sinensis]
MSRPHWANGQGLVMEFSSSACNSRHLYVWSANTIFALRLGGPMSHVFSSGNPQLYLGEHIPNMGRRETSSKACPGDLSNIAGLYSVAYGLLSCLLAAVLRKGMRQWDPSN